MLTPEHYRCLTCGSFEGEAANTTMQNWYWRLLEFGRIGPFCSSEHANSFCVGVSDKDRFTLKEWEHLRFIRETYAQRDMSEVPST